MIYKLNVLQYNNLENVHMDKHLSLSALENNQDYDLLQNKFLKKFGFSSLNFFSFCKDGFLALLLKLSKKGKIAISVGETQSLIDAALEFEGLGFEITYIKLEKNGHIDYSLIQKLDIDFLFVSSYVMDTFIKTDLKKIKSLTDAKIISNVSATFDKNSDLVYFDSYKLTGFSTHGVILHNSDLLEEQGIAFKDTISLKAISKALSCQSFDENSKSSFEKQLKEVFKDEIYFFVDNKHTLPYSLHFGLKHIKAREIIRTLALDEIFITNGEGCSLGLSKPSRIIQEMGYDEATSRNSLSLSFSQNFDEDSIKKIVNIMFKRYKQILVLNEGNNK